MKDIFVYELVLNSVSSYKKNKHKEPKVNMHKNKRKRENKLVLFIIYRKFLNVDDWGNVVRFIEPHNDCVQSL